MSFVQESMREILKVVWPSRAETRRHTVAVLWAIGVTCAICTAVATSIAVL